MQTLRSSWYGREPCTVAEPVEIRSGSSAPLAARTAAPGLALREREPLLLCRRCLCFFLCFFFFFFLCFLCFLCL